MQAKKALHGLMPQSDGKLKQGKSVCRVRGNNNQTNQELMIDGLIQVLLDMFVSHGHILSKLMMYRLVSTGYVWGITPTVMWFGRL